MQVRNINLYDLDLNAIPYFNWHKAQRYILLEAGLGSNASDILLRVNNIQTHIANSRTEDAIQEAQNLTLGIFSALNGINYDAMIFACMVNDIDGKKYTIRTDEDVKLICDQLTLSGVTKVEVQSYIEDLKKKLMLN